jgi:6-phosphogluconate dehydrogenase
LLEITIKILQKKEGDQYLLDLILDKAANKGTGSWSSKVAFDLGVPGTMMSSAVFARYLSSFKEKRNALSAKLSKSRSSKNSINIEALEKAYRFARIINHHQGFDLMNQASKVYKWKLSLDEIARTWTNGCIIKSNFMTDSVPVLKEHGELLKDDYLFELLNENEEKIKEILYYSLENRIAVPCFYSAYDYWISLTTKKLPANLIQAQRDFFGAHTYQRTDSSLDKHFHSSWN